MLVVVPFPASVLNYTPGRDVAVSQIVLHTMVGSRASARATFQSDTLDPAKRRSAHYGVAYEGGPVDEYVSPQDTAWHAGNWPVNQRSIGIEHEDLMHYDEPRPAALYVTSAALVASCATRYGVPLVRVTDPDAPGVMPHNVATATHCPGTLDVDLIIGMARGEVGVFDPRNVPADLAFLDQRIRDIVMGEDIAAFALYIALGRYTGNLPPRTAKQMHALMGLRAAKRAPLTIARTKKVTAAQVRAGHGKGTVWTTRRARSSQRSPGQSSRSR